MQDQLTRFLTYHRRMLWLMLAVAVVITVGMAVATKGDFAWPAGFAAGSVAALVKFAFVDVAVVRKIAAAREGAAAAQLKASVFSLVLFAGAAALVISLNLNVWALAAGIFCPRIILVADAWLRPNPFADTDADAQSSASPGMRVSASPLPAAPHPEDARP